METIGFLGAGTVGTALAVSLRRVGYPVVAVASRSFSSAQRLAAQVEGCRPYQSFQEVADAVQLVFVTTPDDAIAQVVAALCPSISTWCPHQMVVHCSGSLSTDVLAPARQAGAAVGSFHPLQTFASTAQAIENLPGSTFGLEAEEGPLLEVLKGMVQALGGQSVHLRGQDKALYHAAAVLACNYFVTLVKLAADLWQAFGVPTCQSTRAMLPLLRGTLNNLERVGVPGCLTGPIARGDVGTVGKHLAALEAVAPDILPTYRELGRQTIPVALAKGTLDQARAEELHRLLSEE